MFAYLKVEIINIDSSSYPEFATFQFVDKNDKVITVIEKLDILTSLKEVSAPISGFFVECKILRETSNYYLIDISKPYGILSNNNECVFYVHKDAISQQHFDSL